MKPLQQAVAVLRQPTAEAAHDDRLMGRQIRSRRVRRSRRPGRLVPAS